MKISSIIPLLLASTLLFTTSASASTTAKKKKNAPAPAIEQTIGDVTTRVVFYSDGIARVVKFPAGTIPQKKSYSVILEPEEVNSPAFNVSIDSSTGFLTFTDAQGNVLLRENAQPSFDMRKGDNDEGRYRIKQTWTLDGDEAIFGLGQLRDEHINWRGTEKAIWNNNTYISIPYITSEKGYGLYWDNAGRSHFSDNDNGLSFSSEVGTCIDYYFLYRDGTQDGVISSIRQLTGQATMFPLWAMGHWQCRERYKTSDELAAVLNKYRELEIPLDGIVQDWQYWGCDSNWNAMRFMNPYYINKVGDPAWEKYLPKDLREMAAEYKAKGLEPKLKSPEEMVNYVHSNNAHLMISIWASFGPWTEPYRELKSIGALLPFKTWPMNSGVMPYDTFNPKARDIYWKYLTNLYRMGFDAWWTDSTEPDHFDPTPADDDYLTYDGTWRSVKNAFPLMTNKGIYDHQRATKGNTKRSMQMTRSGTFGIQHYGTLCWSGDVNASWNEMKNQVPSGLNFSLCGIPFWNTDLGGFFTWDYANDPHNPALQELYTRWFQWGTFMPLMRNHCSSPMVSELFNFGEKGDWAYDAMVDAVRLRYRLLPYIYSLAGATVQHSGTIMRPFVMDFPRDKRAIRLNDEYMFGPALLVKPVTDPLYTWKDERNRGHEIFPDVSKAAAPVNVYLPEGTRWYDFFTSAPAEGGRQIMRPCPISEIPVYVRAGSILPLGPDVQYSSEKPWDDLEVRVYAGADGSFILYEDEGDNYNYERGLFTEIPFRWDEGNHTLTIGARQGQYKGMLQQRTFRVQLIDGTRRNTPAHTVQYDGTEQTITLP
ncbi:MAG: DUF5110 domain-containing protein [Bacteroidaceae bacterium]|nr:DUF5110 domain-containing protein [Bacteroidaceae bacterium]